LPLWTLPVVDISIGNIITANASPGQVPWRTFRNASWLLIGVWSAGVINFSVLQPIQFILNTNSALLENACPSGRCPLLTSALATSSLPMQALVGVPLDIRTDAHQVDVIDLVCRHPKHDRHQRRPPSLLLLERYAAYELTLDSADESITQTLDPHRLRRLVDIDRCLTAEPTFHASGLVAMQLEHSSSGREIAVLFARGGGDGGAANMRCPLNAHLMQSNFSQAEAKIPPAQLMPAPPWQQWLAVCEEGPYAYALVKRMPRPSSLKSRFDLWQLQVAPRQNERKAFLVQAEADAELREE
jgi:hypothetical protein